MSNGLSKRQVPVHSGVAAADMLQRHSVNPYGRASRRNRVAQVHCQAQPLKLPGKTGRASAEVDLARAYTDASYVPEPMLGPIEVQTTPGKSLQPGCSCGGITGAAAAAMQPAMAMAAAIAVIPTAVQLLLPPPSLPPLSLKVTSWTKLAQHKALQWRQQQNAHCSDTRSCARVARSTDDSTVDMQIAAAYGTLCLMTTHSSLHYHLYCMTLRLAPRGPRLA